jgi:DNA-binding transcriptional regulator YhcF (GntR family)
MDATVDGFAPKQTMIIGDLKQLIVEGELPIGGRLPTHVALAQQYGVSTVTIQRSLDRLRADGFIVARGGRGTFVTDNPPHATTDGIVFGSDLTSADASRTAAVSNFMDTMAQIALRPRPANSRQLNTYFGVDAAMPNDDRARLLDDIRAYRVGGLIFMSPSLSFSSALMGKVSSVGLTSMLGRDDMAGVHLDWFKMLEMAVQRLRAHRRRRVALLTLAGTFPAEITRFTDIATAHGLQTDPHWIMGVDPLQARWAGTAVQLMMRQPPAERPDCLIITDEHLVADAARGLVEDRVSVPDELDIVGHCSFPQVAPCVLPMSRIGFDLPKLLATFVNLLDQQRAGDTVPQVTHFLPMFKNDWEAAARQSV